MIKNNIPMIVNKQDLNLEILVGKEVRHFDFTKKFLEKIAEKEKGAFRFVKRTMVSENKQNLGLYKQSVAKKGNIVAIDDRSNGSISGTLYSDSSINTFNSNGLIEGNYGMDWTNKKYLVIHKI